MDDSHLTLGDDNRTSSEGAAREAEEALAAREAEFRKLAESSPGVMGIYRLLPDGRTCIPYTSPRIWDLFGLRPEDVAGDAEPLLSRTHPDDDARLRESIAESARSMTPWRLEYRVVHPTRGELWIEGYSNPFPHPDGGVVWYGYLQDITERKRAEEDLRRTTALFRGVIEQTMDAVFVKDRDGRYLLCNQATARDLDDRTIAEVLGKDDTAFFRPASARMVRDHDRRVMESGVASTEEEELTTAGGVFRTYFVSKAPYRDERGNVIGVLGIARDVTRRKQADAALHRSEELLRRAETIAHLASWTLNVADRVVLTSGEGRRLFGWDGGPHRLDDLLALVHPDDRPRVQAAVQAALDGVGFEMEHRIVVGGEVKWVQRRVEPETDARGRVVRLIGVSQDITARRRLEEQFQQAQKMEAVGTLAGGVAHDFNNLLTVISGYSDELLRGLPPGDPTRDLLVEIHKAGERAGALTRQLLTFSRRQVVEPKVLDLNAVVADTEKMLGRLIGEDIVLTAVLDPACAPVKADPGQLQQVLMNLAVNARDAMPQGGRLTIETRKVALDDGYAATHPDVRPGGYVRLAVRDTGTGMDPQTRTRIFEPFFTTKGVGKGTGLGLAVVHGVVTQSGGHVDVSSAVGEGTTFEIYLPAATEPLPAGRSVHGLRLMPRGSETVLLVEDEGAVRALVRRVLASCGYTVLEAADGREAVRVAHGRAGPIDLLVSDVVMPHLSGRELAERLTAVEPGLKVLFLSGYTDDAVVRHGLRHAEFAFLQKPFTPTGLAQKVREVLDRRQ